MDETKLVLRCPYCGRDNIERINAAWLMLEGSTIFPCHCMDCNFTGPIEAKQEQENDE